MMDKLYSLHQIVDISDWIRLQDQIKNNFLTIKQNDNEILPLHRAMESDIPPILLRLLIRSYPESLTICNPIHQIPLHMACNLKNTDIIKEIVYIFPEGIHKRDKYLNLPISLYLNNNYKVEMEIVKLLTNKLRNIEEDYKNWMIQSDKCVIDYLRDEFIGQKVVINWGEDFEE